MSVDNIWSAISENTVQPGVHAAIESKRLPPGATFSPRPPKQALRGAFQPPPERNHHGFIPLTVQFRRDMNRYALCATRAQRRNNMKHFNLLHHLNESFGNGIFVATSGARHGIAISIYNRTKLTMRVPATARSQQERGYDS